MTHVRVILTIMLCTVFFAQVALCAKSSESVELQLKRIAEETRKSLPVIIDDIQVTTIVAFGKTLITRYNFTNKKSSLPNLKQIIEEKYNNSLNGACTAPDTKGALKQGVSFIYEFYDSENSFVHKYTIDKNACKSLVNK